jgi:hypothetical protein
MKTGAGQRLGVPGQQDAVRGQADVVDLRDPRQSLDHLAYFPAHQRLAARQPHLVDAEYGERLHQATGLLDVPTRRPVSSTSRMSSRGSQAYSSPGMQ